MANIKCNERITSKDILVEESLMVGNKNIVNCLDSLQNNKTNYEDFVLGQNNNGKYALAPNGLLICWGVTESKSAATYEIPLPYFPVDANYSVTWGMNTSSDTKQSFRGMGTWDKTTTSFKTRCYTATKDWVLLGKWR